MEVCSSLHLLLRTGREVTDAPTASKMVAHAEGMSRVPCVKELEERRGFNSCIRWSVDRLMAAKRLNLASSFIFCALGTLRTFGWYKIAWVAFLGNLSHFLIAFVAIASICLIDVDDVGLTAR